VRDWLFSKDCSKTDRWAIGEDIRYVQERYPEVGLPTWRPLGGGIGEIRTDLTHNRIARVLVCFVDSKMMLLHGFIKKTRATPAAELDLARARMRAAKKR
jgi:phage-related protein